VSYFVKMLGSTDMPMPNDAWGTRGDIEEQVRFAPQPKPTDVVPGDELVYYAVGGYKRVFAKARVESTPELNSFHPNPAIAKRWPYASKIAVRPSTKLKYVSSGPELSAISPGLQSKVAKGVGYFEISRDDFERAVQLLQRAKSEEDRKLRTGWKQ